MLRKLLKFELLATSRTMLPMFALVLAAAVGGNIAVYNLLETGHSLLNTLGILLLGAFVLSMMAVVIVAFVLMIRRFYKNLLRDEGYVMMTLPASVDQQIAAKLLIAVLWFVLTGVVMVFGMMILAFRISYIQPMVKGIVDFLRSGYVTWGDVPVQDWVLLVSILCYLPVILLLACMGMCLNYYAPIAVGHSFSGRKGLYSFAAFFGMMAFWNALGSAFSMLLDATGIGTAIGGMISRLPDRAEVHVVMIGAIVTLLVSNAINYAITAYFLKNRLNLD